MGNDKSKPAPAREDVHGYTTQRLHGRSDDYPHKKFRNLTPEELFDPHHSVVDRLYTYDEVVNARSKMGNAYLRMKFSSRVATGVAIGASAVVLVYFVKYTLVAMLAS